MYLVQNVTKVYRSNGLDKVVLRNVQLEVNDGEFVAILGPSGAGKSTLLRIISLTDTLTKGEYYFNDQKTVHLSGSQREEIRKGSVGFVFKDFNLLDELTVYENVELPLLYLKVATNRRQKLVEEALNNTGVEHKRNQFPAQLPGNLQQRVAVARAVVSKPPLIVADEPTGNLDSTYSEEILKLLTKFNEMGTTIIMATHSPHDANYAQRIIHLLDGKLVTDAYIEQPKHKQY